MARVFDISHVDLDNKVMPLTEWNASLNKTQSMELIEKHSNPIIKFEERARQNLIARLASPAGKIVADVGCERGAISKALAQSCKKIYCIDIDKTVLDDAKRIISDNRAEFIVSDAQNINLPDNSVDVAVSACVLPHLPNPKKGFDELVRITKHDGSIIIHVPNENLILFAKKVLRRFGLGFILGPLSPTLAPGHLHIFDKRKLLNIIGPSCRIKKIIYNFPFFTGVFAVLQPIK